MLHGSLAFGDERVRRLSDSVVKECVGAAGAQHETRPHGVPERRVYRLLGPPVQQS